jgi:UDP-N-acetylmuramyl pentapeptide phosphotransferase/UDP-N-acetylglucosamine-1-phosphate transferase
MKRGVLQGSDSPLIVIKCCKCNRKHFPRATEVHSRRRTEVDVTLSIAASALASFLLAEVLVLTTAHHGRFSLDAPGGAIQKFHCTPTPRIGGIGIYLALLAASLLVPEPGARAILSTILIAGIPALLVGLMEDVTKRIGVTVRLVVTMASGGMACWVSGMSITHINVPPVDALLSLAPMALLFTAFAVGGLANAINIIDGFNGLASGTTTICLLALAAIAGIVGDWPLALASVVVAAAVVGFWLVNFPWGKLFLGDGGAYFAGFALAWLAVLLPMRNAEVSPWASFLLCAYPVIEVLYSVMRRLMHHQSAGDPDRRHLHSLVATHVVQRRWPKLDPTLQNSAVSVIMWACAAVPALAAIALHHRTLYLVIFAVGCGVAYHLLYRRVART